MKVFTISLLTLSAIIGTSCERIRREAALYRDAVNPEDGGKVPESAHLRLELNKIDSAGLKGQEAIRMSDALKDTLLPDKLSGGRPSSFQGGSGYRPYSSGLSPVRLTAPQDVSSNSFGAQFDSLTFPYNPIFDANKLDKPLKPSSREVQPYLTNNLVDDQDDKAQGFSDGKSNYGGAITSKEHLFVTDPYANHAPAQGYNPPSYETDPYAPPHDAAPVYNPYKPQQDAAPIYNPYKPSHDPYKPAHDPYVPYKPKGPVLLEKLPYEVKEIKSLAVSVHQTYTSFDCRKAPYADRHYADPEAGCSIYHFCHGDGRQETFHCPHGTTFNEYLGTCDHAEAVYCTGGEGYAPPQKPHHHQKPSYHEPAKPSYYEPAKPSYYEPAKPSYHEPTKPAYHHPEPYHEPETYHEPEPYHEPYAPSSKPSYSAPQSQQRRPNYGPRPSSYHTPSQYSSYDYEEPSHEPTRPYPKPSFGPAYEPTFDFPKLSGFKSPF